MVVVAVLVFINDDDDDDDEDEFVSEEVDAEEEAADPYLIIGSFLFPPKIGGGALPSDDEASLDDMMIGITREKNKSRSMPNT